MKSILLAVLCIGLVVMLGVAAEQAASKKKTEPATTEAAKPTQSAPAASAGSQMSAKEKLSYTVGVAMGTNLKEQGMDVDLNLVEKGMNDVVAGNKLKLSEEEMQQVRIAFQTQKMAEMKKQADDNKKTGEAFLAANKTKEGVKTTADGLQYKVVKEGSGPKPKETDTVTVQYRGTFVDGKEFDSSYQRNKPATFPLHGVIRGWNEGLQLMSVGSKYMLYIPADLAYGDQGAGGVIPPNSTLIFEVELQSIEPGEKPAAPSEPKAKPDKQPQTQGKQ